MRKEILLAIVIGIIVGLGITFGLYVVRDRFQPRQTLQQIAGQQNATPTPVVDGNLQIQQPKNNFYTQDSTVRVVGRSLPNSYIVILADDAEYITTADQDGDFSQEIELTEGANRVTVVSTTPEGAQEQVILSIVFSTADLTTPASTPSGDEQ